MAGTETADRTARGSVWGTILLVGLAALVAGPAQSQEPAERDSALAATIDSLVQAKLDSALGARGGVEVTASAVEVDLSGRVQFQTATSSCSDFPFEAGSPCAEQAPGVDAFMRRVRLSAVVTINDFLTAKVEPDFGDVNDVVLRDAYGRLTFSDHARVQIGQFKRPFDGFNLVSSSQLLTVERDLDVPGVPGLAAASLDEFSTRFNLASYDIGAMFFGAAGEGRIEYAVGAFNGEPSGVNNDRNAEKQFVGRLTYNLEVGRLPLSVAAAAAVTDLPFRAADDQSGSPRSGEYYTDFEIWAELGDYEPDPHVQAGLIFGDNPLQTEAGAPADPAMPGGDDFATMRSWQVIGAWRFPVPSTRYVAAVEPAFRVTRAEPNTDLDDDEVWGFTPGVNVYFHGRNKLQLGWDFVEFAAGGRESVNSFKSQFQVYF